MDVTFQPVASGTSTTLSASVGSVTVSQPVVWGGSAGGGGTGGATLSISARQGVQQIAPAGIAFFADVSGFDAEKPTDGTVYDPTMHDIAYTWTFSDAGEYVAPVNTLAAWKNRNVSYGPFPAHVFRNPGTYTVTCTAVERSSGKTANNSIQVTIADPEAVFTASTTVVCDPDSVWTGFPAHDTANRTTTFTAALARLRALKSGGQLCRLLLRGGKQYTMTSNSYIGSAYHNLYVTSIGTGRASIKATVNGSIFELWDSIITPGVSISRVDFVGPWDSTTETYDPSYTSTGDPSGVSIQGGFATIHDCTGSGLNSAFSVGTKPALTAIVSDCRSTNWHDYGMYVAGQKPSTEPLTGYVGVVGCRFDQDANALQGGTKDSGDPGNQHGCTRHHAHGYHFIDVLDGFSRNAWTLVGVLDGSNAPADQNIIRDHRNDPRSRAFFSRIAGEGGWQAYSNGSASPDGVGEGGVHRPCNTVLDKVYFMGSARTINFLGISGTAITVRNVALSRPNVGTGLDTFSSSIQIGTGDATDFPPETRSEPIKVYNITVINELDDTQQARNSKSSTVWDVLDFRANCYDEGVVQVQNLVTHRPNFTGGFVGDMPLSNARLGLTPRYLGYRWKGHINTKNGAVYTLDKLTMDSSFATPANPWSLWRPQAGSPAIGSATGLVPYDDLLGAVRPANAARGAIEPT